MFTSHLAMLLSERLGVHLKELSHEDDLQVAEVDLGRTLFHQGANSTVVFSLQDSVELTESRVLLLSEFVIKNQWWERAKLLEYDSATADALEALREIPRLASFKRSEISSLKKTQAIKEFLSQRFLETYALTSINPYTYNLPVTGSRFYGRENELDTVRRKASTSFIISGVRRSGKTSLMRELDRRLTEPGDLCVFVTFETVQSLQDIPYKVLDEIVQRIAFLGTEFKEWHATLSNLRTSRMWSNVANIPRLVGTLSKFANAASSVQRLRFMFDEYDRVLTLERPYNYVVTRCWRELLTIPKAASSRLDAVPHQFQFIFAGSQGLQQEMLAEPSPLYHMAERLNLLNFKLNTLTDLITRPLKEIGVRCADPQNLASALLRITGGHPSTTQHLLSLVVDDPETELSREINASDLRRVADDPRFLGAFKHTIDQNVSSLGRFVLTQMAINKRDRVSLDFLRGIAQRHRGKFDENAINRELEILSSSGYLKPLVFSGGHAVYRLAIPAIPKLFSQSDAEALLPDLRAEGTFIRV